MAKRQDGAAETRGIEFVLSADSIEEKTPISTNELVIAGWVGRDANAIQQHIGELEAIGVKPPRATPLFYRIASSLLTIANNIQVVGTKSSGEAEAVILQFEDRLWVGVGSDHTDRKVESYGVTVSKQICAKPVGPMLWCFDEVEAHWDQLELSSYVHSDGQRRLYQKGLMSGLLNPRELLARYRSEGGAFASGAAMFCGTMPIRGGFQYSDHFEVQLRDPILGRSLKHSYRVDMLQIAD